MSKKTLSEAFDVKTAAKSIKVQNDYDIFKDKALLDTLRNNIILTMK